MKHCQKYMLEGKENGCPKCGSEASCENHAVPNWHIHKTLLQLHSVSLLLASALPGLLTDYPSSKAMLLTDRLPDKGVIAT